MPLLLATPGHAENAPPFRQLLTHALSSAPVLIEQQANVSAERAVANQARAWPNPRLDALSENLSAPSADGNSQRQTTYTLTQTLEIGGKRRARLDASDRRVLAAEARDQQIRIAFAADLAVSYAAAEAAQARQLLADESVNSANTDLRAAQALVANGKEAQLRLAQARASVAAAQSVARAASADRIQMLETLSAMVGISTGYTGVTTSLLALASPEKENPALEESESPVLIRARAERDAIGADVGVEQKRWIPDLGLSVGVRDYAWSNSNGYVAGLSVSIPLFDRNRNGIEAARQRVLAADARLAAVALESVAIKRTAKAQLIAARQRLQAASEGELAADEAYRLGRFGYDAGRTSLMELLLIRRALTEAKLSTIEARLAHVKAMAALSQANGQLVFWGEAEK